MPPRRESNTCEGCLRRSEERARIMADAVAEIDNAIQINLQSRLNKDIPWRLDDTTNIPLCCDEEAWIPQDEDEDLSSQCHVCSTFALHFLSRFEGFSTEDAYLTHHRSLSKPKSSMVYTEAQGVQVVQIEAPPGPSLEDAETKFLRQLCLLASIRGRFDMNKFINMDDDFARIFEGVVAGIESVVRCARKDRDRQKVRLTELKAELEQIQDETEATGQALEALKEERQRRRKCPPPSHVLPSPSMSNGSLVDLSPPRLAEIRKTLAHAKAPGYEQPVGVFALWLQVHKARIYGVPIGPDGVVDLRDVRGRNTIMPRLPPGPQDTKGKSKAARNHYSVCLLAVLKVLIIPGQYHRILTEHAIPVAPDIDLSCAFPTVYIEPPKDEEVVRLLAGQGLTVEAATESWQFCRKLVDGYLHSSTLLNKDTLEQLVTLANDALEKMGHPPEFLPRDQDRFYPLEGLAHISQ
ncbi:hypothetical protein DFH07DRAFT_974996 [Mycena maculata]|uniref:Uncharacterized protein n=1 Tax=Mycena maculata TaxID=230809 RepID=A0AAD7H4I1_9AGAR|nr:hypothetical protein DFH07DRAFT_974996 [Mycena maculata]